MKAERAQLKLLLWLSILLFEVLHSCRSENEKAIELMTETRLIDAHNDLPLKLRWLYKNRLSGIDLRTLDTTNTNINRLKEGRVGAQFWTLYILCGAQNKDAVRLSLEQIDVVKRMCKKYDEFELVTSAQGIADIGSDKIACLIGLEGGHTIDSSLATLRMYYELGVRYLTLTAFCNTPWAQSATHKEHTLYLNAEPLAAFGAEVVKEMNRLGMIIDLTHATPATAMAVLELSKAPVMFSHTGAQAICNNPRNIPDDVLQRLKVNKGILMVSFDKTIVACGDKQPTISAVADHFDHIKTTIGAEHIGIGGEYDGMNEYPEGLEDVSKYPTIIQTLLDRGWSDDEIRGVLKENFLRVFREVEKVRDDEASTPENEEEINLEMVANECRLVLKPPVARDVFVGVGSERLVELQQTWRVWCSFAATMLFYECLHPAKIRMGSKRDLLKMLLCFLMLLVGHLAFGDDKALRDRALQLMESSRLIDGHNDLPLKLRWFYKNKLSTIDLRTLSTTVTNIQKLTTGHVGAQFWSVYVLCSAQNKDAVRLTLEQIDVVKRMCKNYEEFEMVTTAEGIENIPSNKIACLIGIEGGHSIDNSLATLRMYYELGVRYMGLTHTCNTPWAETSSKQAHAFYPATKGLTAFGKEVVKEMNRLGMLIDLSHASDAAARAAIHTSRAPVIFSHSSAFAVCNNPRNVPDAILKRLKKNKGIIMVSFSNKMLACGDQTASIASVADHLDHIKNIAGSQSIGIGSDFEGERQFPEGLEDVSKYPALIEELLRRGWSDSDVRGVLRDNILRVFREVENVRDQSSAETPSEEEIPPKKIQHSCRLDLTLPVQRTVSSSGAPSRGQLSSLVVALGMFVALY
ncbi:uncharacterized protein LOC143823330 isoform X2 [Paroedura picta]|uniref:uncharacterized protein LOC143823330 isoform X2 n=1 Tax=Paroedura picta TaxID=143630 RepID=UPI00405625F6